MELSTSDLICDKDIEKMVVILRAISHPVRLQIVNILMSGERSVGELVRMLGTKQSNTSQQLGILRVSGILKSRGDGKIEGNIKFYSLANDSVKNIMKVILKELD